MKEMSQISTCSDLGWNTNNDKKLCTDDKFPKQLLTLAIFILTAFMRSFINCCFIHEQKNQT